MCGGGVVVPGGARVKQRRGKGEEQKKKIQWIKGGRGTPGSAKVTQNAAVAEPVKVCPGPVTWPHAAMSDKLKKKKKRRKKEARAGGGRTARGELRGRWREVQRCAANRWQLPTPYMKLITFLK